MTSFLDGPAQGQSLMLKRCPIFLRVVVDGGGKWDALDQPEDRPRPGEQLFAYRIEGEPSMCHVRRTGGRGGFYAMGQYRFILDQPEDAMMRDNQAWVHWVYKAWREKNQ